MRILIEDPAELPAVAGRLDALAYAIGPAVELSLVLPCGRTLVHRRGGQHPGARVASLNERLEAILAAQDQDSRGSR